MKLQDNPQQVGEYLRQSRFSQQVQCKRTNHPISYADIGDPDGCPVLFMPGHLCSRWFAVPLDHLCRDKGIRLICVDRPGCGKIPLVPDDQRLEVCSKNILSVLEHLDCRPRHLISFSNGLLYTLHILTHHSAFFPSVPQPVLVSPWIPPQSGTTSPSIPLAYTLDPEHGISAGEMLLVSRISDLPHRQGQSIETGSSTPSQQWRLAAAKIANERVMAEARQGIEAESNLCRTSGREVYERALDDLSRQLDRDRSQMLFTIWWGHHDSVVPIASRVWFNKLIENGRHLTLKVQEVVDGDHLYLLWIDKGLPQVFAMIHFRERVFYGM